MNKSNEAASVACPKVSGEGAEAMDAVVGMSAPVGVTSATAEKVPGIPARVILESLMAALPAEAPSNEPEAYVFRDKRVFLRSWHDRLCGHLPPEVRSAIWNHLAALHRKYGLSEWEWEDLRQEILLKLQEKLETVTLRTTEAGTTPEEHLVGYLIRTVRSVTYRVLNTSKNTKARRALLPGFVSLNACPTEEGMEALLARARRLISQAEDAGAESEREARLLAIRKALRKARETLTPREWELVTHLMVAKNISQACATCHFPMRTFYRTLRPKLKALFPRNPTEA